MSLKIAVWFVASMALSSLAVGAPKIPPEPAPNSVLRITAPEADRPLPPRTDGGLAPFVGAQDVQVFRANKSRPAAGEAGNYTAHDGSDIAVWKSRLYVAWHGSESTPGAWPARELYSTSSDGIEWSAPQELFPAGLAAPLRMRFYVARNKRMLAIASLRPDRDAWVPAKAGALLVREIANDHSLGPVHVLRAPDSGMRAEDPPLFDASEARAFVTACRELLANRLFLEQQDGGLLLPAPERMWWHDRTVFAAGFRDQANRFGNVMSFFRRTDEALVGIGAGGWVTLSADEGKTWTKPVQPPSLVTGPQGGWAQSTSDGRHVIAFHPHASQAYPLALASGADGVVFSEMRGVFGALPLMRYPAVEKLAGVSGVRGASLWSDDGSRRADKALWLTYAVNGEDIWVTRVPVPLAATVLIPASGGGEAAATPGSVLLADDSFQSFKPGSAFPATWNTHAVRWGSIALTTAENDGGGALELRNTDPFDMPRATRIFPATEKVKIDFQVRAPVLKDGGGLEVTLASDYDGASPVRFRWVKDGMVTSLAKNSSASAPLPQGRKSGDWINFTVFVDGPSQKVSVSIEGRYVPVLNEVPFFEPARNVHRIEFAVRAAAAPAAGAAIDPARDVPESSAAVFQIRSLRVTSQ